MDWVALEDYSNPVGPNLYQGSPDLILNELIRSEGEAQALELLDIMREDLKDGTPVNIGTRLDSWASNTGYSKLASPGQTTVIFDGTARPAHYPPYIVNIFEQQSKAAVLNELSEAAFSHK
jgi:hypothetical protein